METFLLSRRAMHTTSFTSMRIDRAVVALLFLLSSAEASALAYHATQISGTAASTTKWDINNAGAVVGGSTDPNIYFNGTSTYLGSPGGLGNISNSAQAINSSGVVAGSATVINIPSLYEFHAIRYSGGTVTDLGTWGALSASALGINDAGTIVGMRLLQTVDVQRTSAFQYTADGVFTDIGTIAGPRSIAWDINNSGTVVGATSVEDIPSAMSHAFAYANGTLTDLGTLTGDTFSLAYSINDLGMIVGYSLLPGGPSHAFAYVGGSMVDLGYLGGTQGSVATAVNNLGQIVGSTSVDHDNDFLPSAFLYTGGVMLDLNKHLVDERQWSLTTAMAINDAGWIVAESSHGGIYLLTPSDDPIVDQYIPHFPDGGCTVALLGMSLAGLVLLRSRK